MYYDSRLITCSFRSTKTEQLIQYGHIVDSSNIWKQTATSATGSATCYWNYGWIVSGLRFKMKLTDYTGTDKEVYFVIYDRPSVSTVQTNTITCLKIDATTATFQFGTNSFNSINGNVSRISFPHGKTLFVEDLDIFFGCDQFVPKNDGTIVPDYYFVINGTKYTRTGSGDRSNWTLAQIPAYKRITNSFSYGYYTKGMTAEAYLVMVYGSSPLGYISSFYGDTEPGLADTSDIFHLWPAYACFHIFTSSNIHNHTKDSQENNSGMGIGGFGQYSGYRQFSNRYEDTPLYFPNKNVAPNSWKYNQLGGESFSLVTAGLFPTPNTERKIIFRIFEGTVTPGPEYSGSNLRLRLILDQVKKTLYLWVSNTDPDNLWIKDQTVPIFWHPLITYKWQFSIHYEHEKSKISVRSKIVNTTAISSTTILGQEYTLLEISGISWKKRDHCFYSWGENDISNSGMNQTASTCCLTDFFCTAETSRFTTMKIAFSLSGDIEEEVHELSLLSGEPTDIFVLHSLDPDSFSAAKKALYSTAELNTFRNATINLSYDKTKLNLENKENGRYIITVLKSGTHDIIATYSSPNKNLISDYSTKLTIFCKLVPELSVTHETADYITESDAHSLIVKAGHDFTITVVSNINRAPDNIVKDEELEISGPVSGISGDNYTYTYTISSLKESTSYDIEFNYEETEENEEGMTFLNIECEDNREKVFMRVYADSDLTTTLSTISLNLPAKAQHVPDPTGVEVDQKRFWVATSLPTAPDSKFSSNSVSLTREPYFTVTKNNQTLWVYPYVLTAISEKPILVCSLYYEETETMASSLATLRISVNAPTSLATGDTGERGALISLTKIGDNWQTSLIMSSSGEKILEEPIEISSSLKTALISYANELTTGGV